MMSEYIKIACTYVYIYLYIYSTQWAQSIIDEQVVLEISLVLYCD